MTVFTGITQNIQKKAQEKAKHFCGANAVCLHPGPAGTGVSSRQSGHPSRHQERQRTAGNGRIG